MSGAPIPEDTVAIFATRETATSCIEGALALRRLAEFYEVGMPVPSVTTPSEQIGDALRAADDLQELADKITAVLGEEP